MDDLQHFRTIKAFDDQILERAIADWAVRKKELQAAKPAKTPKLKPIDKADGRGSKPILPNPFADGEQG